VARVIPGWKQAAEPGTRRFRRPRRSQVLVFVGMLAFAVVMLYPFYFMLDTSFRTQVQFEQHAGYSIASWAQLAAELPVARQLINSTIITAFALLIIIAVSTSAGFAFAKLGFRGSNLVFAGVVAAMMVPLQSIIIPEFVNLSRLGLINTYIGAILVYAALGTPFAVFLMTVFFRGLPDDIIEAAVIDGLSYERIFLRIALPLAGPAVVTISVLQFIQIWDDLLVGLLFLQNPGNRTITVGLAALSSGRTTSIPVLMAGSLVSALPAIIVYLVFQRFLIRGLVLGMGK